MSKKFCSDGEELALKATGKKGKYICKKCKQESPKEKWVCKPKKRKR